MSITCYWRQQRVMLARAASRSLFTRRSLNTFLCCSPASRCRHDHGPGWPIRELEDAWVEQIIPQNTSPILRFDWRRRAPSRTVSKTLSPETQNNSIAESGRRRSYVKRIPAKRHDIKEGELFFEEIQAYQQRCVVHVSIFSANLT